MISKSVRNKYKHWKMYPHPLIFIGICRLETKIERTGGIGYKLLKQKKDFTKQFMFISCHLLNYIYNVSSVGIVCLE